MKKLIKNGKSGFTLVELVIVIAILAIVAAIAIPTVSGVIANANASADASNAQTIEMTIKTCQAEAAANHTTQSATINTLTTNIGTKNKVTDLLAAYSVSLNLGSLRTTGNEFYYDSTTGRVVAAEDATHAQTAMNIGTAPLELGAGSTFSFDTDGNVLIHPAH